MSKISILTSLVWKGYHQCFFFIVGSYPVAVVRFRLCSCLHCLPGSFQTSQPTTNVLIGIN